MEKRRPISAVMKVKCLILRFSISCGICGKWLRPEDIIEWDHIHALVHDGPHEYQNLRPVHAECHKKKTARDIKDNAKIKRLTGATKGRKKRPWPKGRPMQSRPFEKRKP